MEFYVKSSVCWGHLDMIDQILNRFYGLQAGRGIVQTVGELSNFDAVSLTDVGQRYNRRLTLMLVNLSFQQFLFSFEVAQLTYDALAVRAIGDVIHDTVDLTSNLN